MVGLMFLTCFLKVDKAVDFFGIVHSYLAQGDLVWSQIPKCAATCWGNGWLYVFQPLFLQMLKEKKYPL